MNPKTFYVLSTAFPAGTHIRLCGAFWIVKSWNEDCSLLAEDVRGEVDWISPAHTLGGHISKGGAIKELFELEAGFWHRNPTAELDMKSKDIIARQADLDKECGSSDHTQQSQVKIIDMSELLRKLSRGEDPE